MSIKTIMIVCNTYGYLAIVDTSPTVTLIGWVTQYGGLPPGMMPSPFGVERTQQQAAAPPIGSASTERALAQPQEAAPPIGGATTQSQVVESMQQSAARTQPATMAPQILTSALQHVADVQQQAGASTTKPKVLAPKHRGVHDAENNEWYSEDDDD